ncbi:hypothetical protein JYB54_004652 [Salmonella enterica]|nr:hypothetical protein [Salmonella enterica]EHP7185371.1 hypothetical protein [Salmonella enterica subsp. enterica serovar Thompson]EGI4047705.1 hypothetical protein [Salmonella enterica]EGJ9849355.1 hypothetical protein [Salmonella enterica]EHB3459719.1 hypothetical protein [Salmonella enterica]
MSDNFLSKQAFADSLAIRQAVIVLISFLPDEKKALVKEHLNKVAADFYSIPLADIPGITPETSKELANLIADSFLNLAELASISEDSSPTPHQ